MPEEHDFVVVVQKNVTFVQVEDNRPQVVVNRIGLQGPKGDQGEPGIPGAPGGEAFEQKFSSPASTWIVNHNLNRHPGITILNDLGERVFSDVVYGSVNTLTVTFPTPTTGRVALS